jgi:C_GCAxxG_C_C family probable redox protein
LARNKRGGYRNVTKDKRSREKILDLIEKEALDYEKRYHGCSRCAMKALQDHLDLGDGSLFKASTPLGAGVALRGENCGALLAGLLAIGVVTASEKMEDADTFNQSLVASFRFARKFEREFGSTNCREIQKTKLGRSFNMAAPNEYQEFIKAGGYTECSKVAGKAARMAAEFIWDLQEQKGTSS